MHPIFNRHWETIRFALMKVISADMKSTVQIIKTESDIPSLPLQLCFTSLTEWDVFMSGNAHMFCPGFPADMKQSCHYFWHFWVMLYSLWPSNKSRELHIWSIKAVTKKGDNEGGGEGRRKEQQYVKKKWEVVDKSNVYLTQPLVQETGAWRQ